MKVSFSFKGFPATPIEIESFEDMLKEVVKRLWPCEVKNVLGNVVKLKIRSLEVRILGDGDGDRVECVEGFMDFRREIEEHDVRILVEVWREAEKVREHLIEVFEELYDWAEWTFLWIRLKGISKTKYLSRFAFEIQGVRVEYYKYPAETATLLIYGDPHKVEIEKILNIIKRVVELETALEV